VASARGLVRRLSPDAVCGADPRRLLLLALLAHAALRAASKPRTIRLVSRKVSAGDYRSPGRLSGNGSRQH